ncbi:MAG: four helix bundle protein [Patescibacteria group bacterium]|nr:four helix bundle protein [Patescibacteria group bacterium]
MEKLYGDCYDRVRNFPKLDKNLFGKEILRSLNETHKYSLASVYNNSYLPLASASFDLFKKYLRIAVEKKLIPIGWYGAHLEIIVSVGKEISGWLKKTKSPKC